MNFDLEDIKDHLPHYLSDKEREELCKNLEIISKGGTAEYLLNTHNDPYMQQMLQGDGWNGFGIFSYRTEKQIPATGIVLSNSCDVDPANQRDMASRVSFAPLVPLTKYENLLRQNGVDEDRLAEKIKSIKSQQTTNLFFLPAGRYLKRDYVARLDEIYSMPIDVHEESELKKKLFTLSNVGFYMLIFKLSIHFCRLQENISR